VKKRIVFAFLVLLLATLAGAPGAWATGIATDSVAVSTANGVPGTKVSVKHWKHVGGNHFRGSDERAWRQHGLNKVEVVEMRQLVEEKKFAWVTFGSGDVFSSVSFGKNEIWGKTVADWSEGKSYAARLYRLSTGKSIVQVLWCRNWAVPSVVPIPSGIPPKNTPVQVPIIQMQSKERVAYASLDWEVNAGLHGHRNDNANGGGWYLDASFPIVDIGKGFRVGPGLRGMGYSGNLNDESFFWKRPNAYGPQVSVSYNSGNEGFISKTALILGAGYEEYSADGNYAFSQSGKMLLQSFEYYKRLSNNLKVGGVIDLAFGLSQHVTSTSSYADPKDLGSLYVGAYAQRWVSPNWAIRGSLGLRHENIISEWALKPQVTARYKETLSFGPGLNIPLNGNAVSFEAVAGIELKGTIQKAYRKAHGKVVYRGTVADYISGNNAGEKDMPISFGVKIQ
jgi:hypothetical protein